MSGTATRKITIYGWSICVRRGRRHQSRRWNVPRERIRSVACPGRPAMLLPVLVASANERLVDDEAAVVRDRGVGDVLGCVPQDLRAFRTTTGLASTENNGAFDGLPGGHGNGDQGADQGLPWARGADETVRLRVVTA